MKNKMKKFIALFLILSSLAPGYSVIPCFAASTDLQTQNLTASDQIKQNRYVMLDCSNAQDGFVRVKYTADTENDVFVYLGKTSDSQYLYVCKIIPGADWSTIPLTAGDGEYSIHVQEIGQKTSFVRFYTEIDAVISSTPATVYNSYASIDCGDVEDGYVNVKCTADNNNSATVYVLKDNDKQAIAVDTLTTGEDWVSIPLTAGNGLYTIQIWENSGDTPHLRRFYIDLDVTITEPADTTATDSSSVLQQTKAPAANDSPYVGRWVIPSVGVNVAIYASSSQAVTDAKDSANYINFHDYYLIGDHNNQGFNAIKSCQVGTRAFISKENKTQEYICTNIQIGHNTGKTLTDLDYEPISTKSTKAILCYTCNDHWRNVTIVTFEPVNH